MSDPMKSEALIAYAAGILEGEGHIQIRATGPRLLDGSRGSWALYVLVSMGDREPLDAIHDVWGGAMRLIERRQELGHRPMWRLELSPRAALAFLQDVLPHLRSARVRRKATVALDFQRQKRRAGWRSDPGYIARQHDYAQQMRALNEKGRVA